MITSSVSRSTDNSWTINLPPEDVDCDNPTAHQDIQQLIDSNYTVFATNVDRVEDAQVICFGEEHDKTEHKKNSAAIIDALCKEDDVLLLEAGLPNKLLQHSEYQKKPIEIRSWDIPTSEKAIEEILAFNVAENRMEHPSCPTCLDLDSQTIEKASCCTITCALCGILCNSVCSKIFSSCLRKYYKRQYLRGLQKIVTDSPLRNEWMRRNIEAVVSQGKRVFVNAGTAHLSPVPAKKGFTEIDYTPSNESVKETLHYLGTKKFAILIPKERNRGLD